MNTVSLKTDKFFGAANSSNELSARPTIDINILSLDTKNISEGALHGNQAQGN
jgi:hypothetical protein